MKKALNIFVCDGRSRSSLQICRSLSKEGHFVHVGESFFCSTFLSNSIIRKVYYPDPDKYPNKFLNFLVDYSKNNNIDFIFPVRDSSTKILSSNKSLFTDKTKTFLPNILDFDNFQDKAETVKIARKLNIPVPKTLFPDNSSINDFDKISSVINLPFIAKPVISSGSRGIYLIKNISEFKELISKINLEDYILQEFIPHGGALGVYLLAEKGNIIAINAHYRLREYPYSGGPSTFRESIKNTFTENISKKLVKFVKWSGPAMVEFRIHSKTRIPYLMEVNPRFWGSLAVDIHSGVDFPNLILNKVFYNKIEYDFIKRKTGIKVRWLFLGDLLWFLMHPNKDKILTKFINFRGNRFDILSWQDPLPVIGSIIEGFQSLFKSKRRDHVFRRGW